MKFEPLSIFVLTLLVIFCIIPKVHGEIIFEDVTNFAGIQYDGSTYGSSWGDLNGDGWADLWQGNHGFIGKGSKIYLNTKHGSFLDITSQYELDSILDRDNHGASWADFDNDGDQDLFVIVGGQRGIGQGPNIFLVNENGELKDKATDYELDYPFGRGRTSLWFDSNVDGLLDIVLANSRRPDQTAPTILFVQTPFGFKKLTTLVELANVSSVTTSDLDLDGKMELVFLSGSKRKIYDVTDLPFTDLRKDLNLKKVGGNDWSISDFNGDLRPDIFTVTGGYTKERQFLNDTFFMNNGSKFENRSFMVGLKNPTACRSVVSGDFDNDMDLDVYSVCSVVEINLNGTFGRIENIPNMLYENLGNGIFFLVQGAGGAEGTDLGLGESVSSVDYNNDGFLDLYVTNGLMGTQTKISAPSQLFKNVGNDNHWVEIDLVGTKSNRDGIGAKVIVSAGDIKQIREQNGGIHYRAQNHQRIHFGLGNNELVDNVIVYWPSGIVSAQKDIISNQILKITEPSKSISPKKQLDFGIKPSDVRCNEGLDLFFKTISKVICVEHSTANKLIERGWLGVLN